MQFIDILNLHLHIACTLTCGIRNTRDVVHLRVKKQVFISIRLIHKQVVDT